MKAVYLKCKRARGETLPAASCRSMGGVDWPSSTLMSARQALTSATRHSMGSNTFSFIASPTGGGSRGATSAATKLVTTTMEKNTERKGTPSTSRGAGTKRFE